MIECPPGRIVPDVGADDIEFTFTAYDMFVIVALPDGDAGGGTRFVNTFGNRRFV